METGRRRRRSCDPAMGLSACILGCKRTTGASSYMDRTLPTYILLRTLTRSQHLKTHRFTGHPTADYWSERRLQVLEWRASRLREGKRKGIDVRNGLILIVMVALETLGTLGAQALQGRSELSSVRIYYWSGFRIRRSD